MIQSQDPNGMLKKGARVFFVGIGGISMAGLAEISHAYGMTVAGSDRHPGARTDRLAALGIEVHAGHRAERIDAFRPDWVVHTAAVHPDNPERIRATELGIPVIDRAVYLGWINRLYSRVINISGTHGKTTTTAMCSSILIRSGRNPTVHLGADLAEFGGTVRLGTPGDLMVSEACEYMRSFLQFHSTTAAILNIEYDHVDCFRDIDDVTDAFTEFARHVPSDGTLVLPAFDARAATLLARLADEADRDARKLPEIVSFGRPEDRLGGNAPTVTFSRLTYPEGCPSFDVVVEGSIYASIRLRVPGEHNVMNALAAVACAWKNGGTPEGAREALESYTGAEGRFDIRGTYRGAVVISDYAHHPSAVRATLRAAAAFPHAHTWVVFQPLTFSRTRILFDDFVAALLPCEFSILAEIFSDRETDPGDIRSEMIAARINGLGGNSLFAASFPEIKEALDGVVSSGDLILVLGPEEIRGFADWLLAAD
ncbi:MAG: UDP-N-acetylmuramate--L-alanine ligase [Clostridia bacterium]|nr:UDP-N-acetylmuramate--L-alanine ligase [Clostridia bacterium]